MRNQPWWQPIAQHALWLIAMSAVMGWLARSRLKPRPAARAGELVYPPGMLIVGLLCVAFFAAIAMLSVIFPGKDGSIFISLFFAAFALMGVPLVVEYFRV